MPERDLMLVKLKGKQEIKNVLLSVAGGEHALAAEKYAASLVHAAEGELTICRVTAMGKSAVKNMADLNEELEKTQARIRAHNGVEANIKLLHNKSIEAAIKKEAKKYDTVVLGATRESMYQQIMFGSIPEKLAKELKTNMIVIKHHSHVSALWGKVLSEEVE